jgi:hemerythrin
LRVTLTPYDLKKIDIGGGMVHGNVKDFQEDTSGRLLLSHYSRELTPEEKEIGSSTTFGTIDVLMKGQKEEFRRHAFVYLQANLPGVSSYDLRILINHPIMLINPGAIFLKEGDASLEMLLLLSGWVERIRICDNIFDTLSPGSLIGEDTLLDKRPSQYTYRASSFVWVLRLPIGFYNEVIRRNGLSDYMRRVADLRNYLNTISLFSEGLSAAVLGRIIDGATERNFQANELINGKDILVINIVRSGLVERTVDGKILDVLNPHDSFGEEGAILKIPSLYRLRALKETSVLQIPGELLEDVPKIRWKILENYQHRTTRIVLGND